MKRTPDAIDRRLARQAVSQGFLTIWQAQQILAGRGFALQIGKYVLLDLIGQGGMGRVYLARDTRLKRLVALKILSRERMSNPRALARFEREAKVGAQLQHDNLVRIYDEGEAHSLRFLVMEFIEGKNVGQILSENGPLPWATAAKITRQVALGLQHAHEKDLIHRDVNPSNILVTRDGTAKLTDLGLAIDLADLDDIVTRDGATVGTFDYISPEQARHSRGVDGRSDIYSLGCALYHMIAGRVPFPTPSLPEKLYAHQLSEPEPLTALVPGVPKGLEAVVHRMMQKKVEDRYQRPIEVAFALDPFVEGAGSLSQISRSPVVDESPEQSAAGLFGSSLAPPAQSASDPELGWNNEEHPTPRPTAVRRSGEIALGEPISVTPAASATQPLGNKMGLMIDLGPEPSLSDSLSGVRAKRSKSKSKPAWKFPIINWRSHTRPLAIGAGLLVLMITVVLAGWAFWNGSGSAAENKNPLGDHSDQKITARSEQFPEGREPFALLREDGQLVTYSTLGETIMRAGAGLGEVLLGDVGLDDEIHIAELSDILDIPRRPVVIRAAKGCLPTLSVRMSNSSAPLFLQRSGSLTLSGVRFRVNFDGPGFDAPTAPVVLVRGELNLDRCAFVVEQSRGSNTVAVQASNQGARINGCLFRGFDYPVDLEAVQNVATTLNHCIMIWPQGAQGQGPGWAIRAQALRTEGDPSQITLERCSVLGGQGLLQLSGVSEELPVRVLVQHSAIRTQNLLCWAPENPAFPTGLQWSGQGNIYDVDSAAWVVSSPTGVDHPEDIPNDLESWREAIGGPEADSSTSGMVDLADGNRPFLAGVSFNTQVYRLENAQNPDGEPIGADPSQVGPNPAHDARQAE